MGKLHFGSKFSTIVLLWALLASLLLPSTAYAISDYDAIQLNGGQPELISSQCNSNTDLSSWEDIVQNQSKWTTSHSSNFSGFMTDYATAKSNGNGWALLENRVKHANVTVGDSQNLQPGDTHITLMVTPGNINAQFVTNSTYDKHLSPIENTWLVRIALTNDCTKGPMVVGSSKAQSPASENQLLAWDNSNSTWLGSLVDIFPIFINYNITYPSGYAGTPASDPAALDIDGDGLLGSQEALQGTSDGQKDTDNDGLNDYIESQWYPNRQSVFCGTSCAYPNPVEKDLYVEIDWMKDSARTMKPSATQLAKVEEAFADQNITVHFDTGLYGGGNELPTYTQDLSLYRTSTATDFYDYKYGNSSIASNFDTDRYKIWHYIISGYRYTQNLNSSGASYVGDDDTFISLGKLEDNQGSNADNAIAGTILHELGHSVCLSDTQQYTAQSADCVYAGIDTEDDPMYSSYNSVMNYDYQFSSLVDLSNGVGTPEDHNDWSAVAEGMGDFVNSDAEGEDPGSQNFMSPNSRTFAPYAIRHITQ